MKLSSLFPQPKTLAGSATLPRTEAKTEMPVAKKPGPIPVTWPKVRPQKVKDYKPITTEAELVSYLQRCEVTGFGSFDWETAPAETTREHFARLYEAHQREIEAIEDSKEREKAAQAFDKTERAAYLRTPLDPWKSEICTVSLSAAVDESRVVPISHKKGKVFEPSLSRAAARKLVMDTLDRLLFRNPKVLKIAVNLAFEAKFAAKYGKYILSPVADPLTMWVRCMQVTAPQKIKDPKRPTEGWGLKPTTKAIFGVQMGEFTEVLKSNNADFFDEIDASDGPGLVYSAEDADYGLQQYLYWAEVARQIPGYEKWLHEIEMPFSRVIGLMEYWGMKWDAELADVKRQEAEIILEQASDAIKKIAKDTFDVDVNPGKTGKTGDVKHLLFELMQVPAAKWSDKTGDPSLDEEAIIDMKYMLEHNLNKIDEEKYLAVELPDSWETIDEEKDPTLDQKVRGAIRIARREPHPYRDQALQLLDTINRIQKYSTLLSSHIIGREKHVNEVSGRIHASYTPWTETSRLNSMRPNGQNVPRLDNDDFGIRNFYQAPPGKILFLIDFSGFELRLMAWKSGDPTMTEIFRTGGDMHRRTASTMTNKPESEITKVERTNAKAGNFGISYGGTEHALQKTFKTDYGIRKTLGECYDIVQAVKKTYDHIPQYQKDIVVEALDQGYVSTIYGYIRMLPGINSTHVGTRMGAERQAANTPIQGSAADIMKRAQNAAYEEIGRGTVDLTQLQLEHAGKDVEPAELMQGFGIAMAHGHVDMIAQIHDEVIFEMDDDPVIVKSAMDWIKAEMEKEPLPDFPIPIEAEASIGYRWGDKMPVSEWLQQRNS